MRINKENVHVNRVKCVNTLQITLDDDFNVPDNKEDIEAIVKEWGNVRVDSIKTTGSRADVSGCLDFALLYVGKGNSLEIKPPVVSMSGSMNYSDSVNLSEDGENGVVTCNAKLEDITIKAINSRKISVKALICITVTVEEVVDVALGMDLYDKEECDCVQCLRKQINYTRMAVNLHDTLRIRENVSVGSGKPEIQKILWSDVTVHNVNSRLTDSGVDITGEITVFVMYATGDEKEPCAWYETNTGFEGKLDINGCSPDMISCIRYSLVSKNVEIKPDYNGENRELAVEMVLDLTVKAYEECEKDIIADLYSPVKNVKLTTALSDFKRLVIRNNSKCRAQERVKVADYINILQICNCTGEAQIDDITQDSDGLNVDGAIIVNVFYITADDGVPMGSLRVAVPFSTKIMADIADGAEYTVDVNIDQLSAAMSGSKEIEIKGSVMVDVIVFDNYSEHIVTDCAMEDYQEDEYLKMPCMVGYIASGEDTLWDIAKRYHTTIESIKRGNPLLNERTDSSTKIKKGEKLLLMKAAR